MFDNCRSQRRLHFRNRFRADFESVNGAVLYWEVLAQILLKLLRQVVFRDTNTKDLWSTRLVHKYQQAQTQSGLHNSHSSRKVPVRRSPLIAFRLGWHWQCLMRGLKKKHHATSSLVGSRSSNISVAVAVALLPVTCALSNGEISARLQNVLKKTKLPGNVEPTSCINEWLIIEITSVLVRTRSWFSMDVFTLWK